MHGQNKRTVNYGKYLNVHVNARNSSTLILTEMYIYIHRLTGRKHYTVTLILGLGSKGISRLYVKKVKVAHTRLPSVGFRS